MQYLERSSSSGTPLTADRRARGVSDLHLAEQPGSSWARANTGALGVAAKASQDEDSRRAGSTIVSAALLCAGKDSTLLVAGTAGPRGVAGCAVRLQSGPGPLSIPRRLWKNLQGL